MFKRIRIEDAETWHGVRKAHIQASEAAAVLGCSPWRSPAQLYDIKVGAVKEPDIGDKPYIRYGKAMEPLIRAEFELDHPYLKVEYHEFDVLESIERPWQGCTLDGEVEVVGENPWGLRIGAKGVLEIKTASFRNKTDLEAWEGQIPEHYYPQVVHQLSVTGWDFAVVVARIKRDPFKEEDNGFPEVVHRSSVIKRDANMREDIRVLEEEEAHFWKRIQERRRPPMTVSFRRKGA